MGRRIFTASRFNGGMILNADPSDLPEGYGVVCLNTMSSLDSGSIGGRYADGASDGYDNVIQYATITDGSSYHLASLDADGELWADGVKPTVFAYALGGKCITGHRNYALVGRGRSERPLYYGYPNGATEPVICEHDLDPNYLGHTEEFWEGIAFLEEDAIVYYAASIVYDGYLHGPLKKFYTLPITQPGTTVEGVNYPSHVSVVRLTLTLLVPEEMEKRVSSVILYRSVASPGTIDTNQASEYTKVVEFTDFENMVYVEGNTVMIPGGEIVQGITPVIGNSFTNESGLDETLSFCTLSYETAYEMNNFLFVGNVGHVHAEGFHPNGREILVQDIEDGTRLLYRSLRGKHGQFSIISDFLALSFTPIAMTSFNNRLIVFGSAEFAVVNPETMTVEEVAHGYGLDSALCVYSTLSGVFFANRNNMYVFDGRDVVALGTPVVKFTSDALGSFINDLGVYSYEQIAEAFGGIRKVVYSARINSVLFLYSANGETSAYVFSLESKVWSVFTFSSMDARSAYIDRSNVLFIGGARAMSSAEKYPSWKYVTKRFDLGSASQWKKIYSVYSASSLRQDDISMSFDGGGFTSAIQRRMHDLVLKYEPSEENGILSGIEITYREMNIH